MQESKKKKLYIGTLKFNTWQKRMYFEGEDSEYGQEQFKKASLALNEIGDNSKEWLEFLNKAIETYSNFDFIRVQK